MDQDTYEQLMQIRISLDELEEKINLVLDEIDELKINMEEKPCGHLAAVEQQRAHAQKRINCDMSSRDVESLCVTIVVSETQQFL